MTIGLNLGQKIKAQDFKIISVTIIDNGLELKIKTSQNKVENILNEAKIKIEKDDLVFPNLSSEVEQNYKILIYRSIAQKNNLTSYIVQPDDTVSEVVKKIIKNEPKPQWLVKTEIRQFGQSFTGLASWYNWKGGWVVLA